MVIVALNNLSCRALAVFSYLLIVNGIRDIKSSTIFGDIFDCLSLPIAIGTLVSPCMVIVALNNLWCRALAVVG
jgi:hypothetical protein